VAEPGEMCWSQISTTFRQSFSWDMTKMHYFWNKVKKSPSVGSFALRHPFTSPRPWPGFVLAPLRWTIVGTAHAWQFLAPYPKNAPTPLVWSSNLPSPLRLLKWFHHPWLWQHITVWRQKSLKTHSTISNAYAYGLASLLFFNLLKYSLQRKIY